MVPLGQPPEGGLDVLLRGAGAEVEDGVGGARIIFSGEGVSVESAK